MTTGGIAVCGADTYSAAGQSACTACLTNYHTSGTSASAHNNKNDCKIVCNGGYYLKTANDTTCTAVGAGKWAAASTVAQGSAGSVNSCATGLTTVGYGPGADEAGDCGRVFHVGENVLYLRSDKKTTPAFNVKIGDTIYYGNASTTETNMSNGTSKKMRVKKIDGTLYWIHDDSVEVPSGYTPMSYIQSSGSSYLNTGFIPSADFKHTLVFELISTSTNSSKYICGTGVDEGRSGNVRIDGSTIDGLFVNVGSGAAVNILQSTTTISGKTTLVMDLHNNAKNTVLLNGQNVANNNVGTITSTRQLQLFALASSYLPTGVRIYNSIIEQDGEVIRNFVPVKNSSNVCGMYDTVSGTFFGSATSTAFTCQ